MKIRYELGDKFGRLKIIGHSKIKKFVSCECQCGAIKDVRLQYLLCGDTKSCGCFLSDSRKTNGMKNRVHGMTKTKTYQVWRQIKRRCIERGNKDYKNYGGRGIKICNEWFNFINFFKDMGIKPDSKSLGRTNNNGDYTKSNCRWETTYQQSRNKRTSINIKFNGKTMNLKDWSKNLNIGYQTLRQRIVDLHWPIDKAFTVRPWSEYENQI